MTEILLFHHAQGLTPGVRAFADDLRAGGHIVHTPDLFDGRTFQSIDEGLAYIAEIGFDEMRERGVRVADELPPALVYAGFSFGVLPAQKLAQTRAGAREHCSSTLACRSVASGPSDPGRMASRSRSMVWRTIRSSSALGDIDAAREIVEKVEDAELFLYPGDQHYFADSSLPSCDANATALLTNRVLEFLDRV
ncbi:hypothetical protein KGO5_02397 [Sinorhizobium sp. KGO-5]|nr:hypothetical protein KGO5_02397 [Sinorhizobium sp. KGO-5]